MLAGFQQIVRHRLVLLCLALSLPFTQSAYARAEDTAHNCADTISDAEVMRRLTWIDARLSKGARGASLWWGSWLAYAATEAGYGWAKYARAEDQLDRDTWLVTGLGSTLWITQMMFFPTNAAYAPLRMRKIPRATAIQRRLALPRAEHLLNEAAKSEREGLHWGEHVLDLVWAVGSAAFIFARNYRSEPHARVYKEVGLELGITVLVSEAAILTTPRQAIRDLKHYQENNWDRPLAVSRRSSAIRFGIASVNWILHF